MEVILATEHLTKKFKGLTAVNQLELKVLKNEIHGLIGPNGSGKSTTINLLTGFLSQTEGTIRFAGKNIQNLPSYKRAAIGLVRTFQEPSVFGSMTVEENMRTTINHAKQGEGNQDGIVNEALEILGLLSKKNAISGNLSYGEQKLLDIAKITVLHPIIVLLDEPAAGLSGVEKTKLFRMIRLLKERGSTILFSEHDVGLVMELSDRITVLNFGNKICEGQPDEVRRNPQVIEAYLGGSA